MKIDEVKLAAAFGEWERRYRENPLAFADEQKREELAYEEFGLYQARYLIQLLQELG